MLNIGSIVKIEWYSIHNDLGGTTEIKEVTKVKITDKWHDYETGWRFVGELINKEDIEKARIAGTTGKTPEDYKDLNKSICEKVLRSYYNYEPEKVYFSEFDIIKGRKKHSSTYAFNCMLEKL